jgi:hypothetical protein
MPIPQLTAAGLLPDGLHECTVEEVMDRFGRFQESDRRPSLGREFQSYLSDLLEAGVGKYLVVDGSFVTAKASPSDIDLLLVLRDDLSLTATVPPFQYNPRSRTYVRKKFPFDFFIGFDDDESSSEMIAHFRRVKYRPGEAKGMLKVLL